MGPHEERTRFVGERKAMAAAVLALYTLLFLASALNMPDPALARFFGAMAAVYGVAFFGLVAGYFWARWFAIGLGIFGAISGAMAIWQIGLDFLPLFFGGTHGLVSLSLWGNRMAGDFDGRADWRERFHMDENATRRLGKAVIRAGVTLPMLIAYGLAPRDSMLEILVATAAVGMATLGVWGLLRLRTWGVLVMVAGAAAVLGTTATATTAAVAPLASGGGLPLPAAGVATALLLLAAVAPLAGPIVRYLRR